MKTFNAAVNTVNTKVQLAGEYGFRRVKEIFHDRTWLKVHGCGDSFQRDDVVAYTNRGCVEMYPAFADLYVVDQYGSVYERGADANMFIGSLNGRTLKVFLQDQESVARTEG